MGRHEVSEAIRWHRTRVKDGETTAVGAAPEMIGIAEDGERTATGAAPEMTGVVEEETMTTITTMTMTTIMIMTTIITIMRRPVTVAAR
jgi:hypothetical protein